MGFIRQPEQLSRLTFTMDQKGHIPRTGRKPRYTAERGCRGEMGRQEIDIHLAYHDWSRQIQANPEIRMNLSQKTDHLIPAEDATGFSRMKDLFMDIGPE